MSDQSPPQQPELELARPAKGPSPGSAGSSPRLPAVRSAARADASTQAAEPAQKITRERLKEGAVDTLLNSISILGEVLEDFRNSDRFFKYKALVLAMWLALTVGAFGVACPQSAPTNDINARLVMTDTSVFMVKNDSGDAWTDVEIVVNHAWRATETSIAGNGGYLTLSRLYDAAGNQAPSNLKITDIEVRVLEPEATVVLLRNGVPQ